MSRGPNSTGGLAELQGVPAGTPEELVCERCGRVFVPLHGKRNRKYCYDPECEREREREKIREHYKRWSAKRREKAGGGD